MTLTPEPAAVPPLDLSLPRLKVQKYTIALLFPRLKRDKNLKLVSF